MAVQKGRTDILMRGGLTLDGLARAPPRQRGDEPPGTERLESPTLNLLLYLPSKAYKIAPI